MIDERDDVESELRQRIDRYVEAGVEGLAVPVPRKRAGRVHRLVAPAMGVSALGLIAALLFVAWPSSPRGTAGDLQASHPVVALSPDPATNPDPSGRPAAETARPGATPMGPSSPTAAAASPSASALPVPATPLLPTPTPGVVATPSPAPTRLARFGDLLETADVAPAFGRPGDADPFASIVQGEGVSYLGESIGAGTAQWHLVQFLYWEAGRREWMTGWVSGSIGEAGDLVPIARRGPVCPRSPDVTSLGGRWPIDYLSCADELTLTGYIGDVDLVAAPIYRVRPRWLGMDTAYLLSMTPGRGGVTGALQIQMPPGSSLDVPLGTSVRVRGRFDDPRSRGCTRQPTESGFPAETAELQALWCRQRFVATSITPLSE